METGRFSEDDTPENGANGGPESPPDVSGHGAPRYPIPRTKLSAVEVPAVIQNLDRAIKAFGRVPTLNHVSNCT